MTEPQMSMRGDLLDGHAYDKTSVLNVLLNMQPALDRNVIEQAYDYCVKAHEHQVRKSGEPYLQHPVEVAKILAEQHLDTATVAASLLHDVVEDSPATEQDIRREFGNDVAFLVDGVTKIAEIQMSDRQERQAETFRKMLLSMAKDIRVILIKFADRLHNLRTLDFLAADRIRTIANETLEVYAPLAHRLGMAKIKTEMEDLSFRHIHPNEYQNLVKRIHETRQEREAYIEQLTTPLQERMREEGLEATVYGRSKHLYSIHRKMVQRGVPFEEIFDLFALRIIVESIRDCYLALGEIHALWCPLASRFKDYIANPKSNMYQSLHTTVVGPEGKMVEIQIRTEEMHRTAEAGIAAHWQYKEGGKFSASDEHMEWLRQIEEWQKELTDSNEFLEFLKIDLFPAEIFIFTPKGDVMQFPKGATALDFAFAVHTNLGLHCIGCKINGKIMPLDTPLKSGSTVEILRSENQSPNREWLHYVRTSKAKSALRRWLNQEGKVRSRDLGSDLLIREYKNLNIDLSYEEWLNQVARNSRFGNSGRLLEMMGKGQLSVRQLLHKLPENLTGLSRTPIMKRLVGKISSPSSTSPIRIANNENLMIRFARCCMPVPGEKIVGFLTKGRGVSVHRLNCPNAVMVAGEKDRCVPVEWNTDNLTPFRVRIEVIAKNRINLLSELTRQISQLNSHIVNAHISTRENVVHDIFIIEVIHLSQLKKIATALKRVKGVQRVARGRLEEPNR